MGTILALALGALVLYGVLRGAAHFMPQPKIANHSRDGIRAIAHDWEGDDCYDFEVVGESHYQSHLRRIAGGRERVYTTATLEDDNRYDPNAVGVQIGGRTVGYLSRDDARHYRRHQVRSGSPASHATCRAVIVSRAGGSGVWLDLPIENHE